LKDRLSTAPHCNVASSQTQNDAVCFSFFTPESSSSKDKMRAPSRHYKWVERWGRIQRRELSGSAGIRTRVSPFTPMRATHNLGVAQIQPLILSQAPFILAKWRHLGLMAGLSNPLSSLHAAPLYVDYPTRTFTYTKHTKSVGATARYCYLHMGLSRMKTATEHSTAH
jgi:hypothetical protein